MERLNIRSHHLLIWIAAAALAAASGRAAPAQTNDAAAGGAELFRTIVQPTLKQQCLGCHGQGETFAKLDLRTREAALRGGQRGPAVVPFEPARSLLIQAIEHAGELKMPPGEDAKLPLETLQAFRSWVGEGAPFVESTQAAALDWAAYKDEDLWAFRPLRDAVPPSEGVDPALVQTPVDSFILRKLTDNGLTPAPRTDRATLIHRAAFDLTGLPPTPQQVDSFVNDRSPNAYKELIERLLASPEYGERWGRHWLDVARYADTNGYSNDFERPNAWRYRDYVIRSFNNDKPYDRFILEQIAGDELFPNDSEALIAAGFLRGGPWEHTGMSVAAVTRQMFLDDVTHNTAATFLGLTLGCARCHDHKFDPIPTKDYYRMQAVFATTEFARRQVPFLPDENIESVGRGRSRMSAVYDQTMRKRDSYAAITHRYLMKKHGVASIDELPKDVVSSAVRARQGVSPEDFEALKLHNKHLTMHKVSLDRFEPLAFSVSSGLLGKAPDAGPNSNQFAQDPYVKPDVYVLIGGDLQSQGERVAPGAPSLVEQYGGLAAPEIPDSVAGRRAALAKWIADPRNPLTARVMVNRVWQYHFGKGIAENPNNLGKMGKKPTHPELLDWLARFFISRGWSVKALHRVIMLSETYQRSSRHANPKALEEKDPEDRYLARFRPRRLEAEELRDSVLAVAGELSDSKGGPGTFPQINRDVAAQPRHAMGTLRPAYFASPTKRMRNRRSVYGFQQRSLIDPMIEVFNGPSLDESCERRDSTTVPTQAFSMFNGEFMHDMALAMAVRLGREAGDSRGRIERAFRLTYGRPPSEEETRAALRHLESMTEHHRSTPPPPKAKRRPLVRAITSELTGERYSFEQLEDPAEYEANVHPSEVSAETRALADLALVLLNSNEFVYVY